MLTERLGYCPDSRLLIINADDFGMCGSTNGAIVELLRAGAITSASLMTACPWMIGAAAIAREHPEYDVGAHLTLTSEWDQYKWGPVSSIGSGGFVDKFGHFPKDGSRIGLADPLDIRRECVAQIEAALSLGVDLTHLDNHMVVLQGAMGASRDYTDLLIDLAARYRLPLRLPRHPLPPIPHDEKWIRLADESGVVLPDYIEALPFILQEGEGYETVKWNVSEVLRGLKPGVTELIFHPSAESDELKGITNTWPVRQMEYEVFLDPYIQSLLEELNIVKISWRDLRDLQRA